MVNPLLVFGVDQLYDGAGKAIALQVKLTKVAKVVSCDNGLVVITGLTAYEKYYVHKLLCSNEL